MKHPEDHPTAGRAVARAESPSFDAGRRRARPRSRAAQSQLVPASAGTAAGLPAHTEHTSTAKIGDLDYRQAKTASQQHEHGCTARVYRARTGYRPVTCGYADSRRIGQDRRSWCFDWCIWPWSACSAGWRC
jgi:hypothetical protein